jgi:hypothetical protein
VLVLGTIACSSPSLPQSRPKTPDSEPIESAAADETTIATDPRLGAADVVVDAAAPGQAIDDRLLGTNVPAWLGPESLASEWLRSAIDELGVELVRMPGGSWSNGYGWSACELRQPEGCIWEGAARPADFADLLADTGVEGMWTVSINETAQSAAALVAYFNAELGNSTVIGVDRNGVDWGTAGDWAAVRASSGKRQPVRIELWEIGNEVFGGRPESGGDQCAEFGWETVWTCDGTEYVVGDGAHDGYLDIRAAMLMVDSTISVGAVGVAEPASWSNWGNEVIGAAEGELDFYVVHEYPFNLSPGPVEAAESAASVWPRVVGSARQALPDDVAVAITEYNLVAVQEADAARTMTSAVNALFIADTIGQLAELGVEIANQWNLANGTAENGTDYGLVDAQGRGRFPQFEGFAVWGRAGDELLPVELPPVGLPRSVRAYPTRHSDGSIDMILLNLGDLEQTVTIRVHGAGPVATLASIVADDPKATEMRHIPPIGINPGEGGVFEVVLPAWSISELTVGA